MYATIVLLYKNKIMLEPYDSFSPSPDQTVQNTLTPVSPDVIAGGPTQLGGNAIATDFNVRFETFSEAETAKKQYSDAFIDGAIGDSLTVGGEHTGVKGYLDKIEPTKRDIEVIDSPDRIAGLYVATTNMLARNLKLKVIKSADPEQTQSRRDEVRGIKDAFLAKITGEAPAKATEIASWTTRDSKYFPAKAMEYHGFNLDGKDILDFGGKGVKDVRPNFKIQRQPAGTYIMAYSDQQVLGKFKGTNEVVEKRVYVNPDMEAVPELFEKILQNANEAGLSIQLKMFQRAPELAMAHRSKEKGGETGGIRGDGIVIGVSADQADDVLGMVIALAKDNPWAFSDRKTSRIPQYVAKGIAVGEDLGSTESLTSSRAEILSEAAALARDSGKQGAEARALFCAAVSDIAISKGINPDNIAFKAR
jgi:hypothetical protein